jgi:hypothetical protein
MNTQKDWISAYSPAAPVRKFQEGGPMAPPAGPPAGPAEGAPAPEAGGGDIEGMIAEYAQTRDPQLAVAICDMIVEMMAQGGGEAPAGPEAGAPMAKKGMKMKNRGPVFKGSGAKKGKC